MQENYCSWISEGCYTNLYIKRKGDRFESEANQKYFIHQICSLMSYIIAIIDFNK